MRPDKAKPDKNPQQTPPFSVKAVMMNRKYIFNFAKARRASKTNPGNTANAQHPCRCEQSIAQITKEIVSVENFVIGVISDKEGYFDRQQTSNNGAATPSARDGESMRKRCVNLSGR